MSVVAKYCEECGLKIPQEHFEDGRAISYLYLSYCENCKKKVEKLYNAFQEFASFEAAEEKKSFIYQILVLVVALVIGAVLTFFATRYFVKASAAKQIAAVQGDFDNFKTTKAKEVKGLNNELTKKENALTILKDEVEKLKAEGGAPEKMQALKDEIKKAQEDYKNLSARYDILQRDRDNERMRANRSEQETNRWKKIAEDKGLVKLADLQDENDRLNAENDSIKRELARLQDEVKELKRGGTAPDKLLKQLQNLEITQLVLGWALAINSHDAPTLKKLYTKDSPLGRELVSQHQKWLDETDIMLNVKIKNIDVDTSTASVDLDVGYRSGKIIGPVRNARMSLVKEENRWTIRDEGF